MLELIGKLHPLLVHMPIGIFVFAIIFKMYAHFKKWENIESTIKLLLIVSFLFSVFSIISGLILGSKGDYELAEVNFHRNMGILFAFNVFLIYFFRNHNWVNIIWFSGAILLIITGHQGGNLTHGEGFLSIENKKTEPIPIKNIQEAQIYNEVIKPILEEKCVQCHSSKKQKGKLRLDTEEYILKGGESGSCITPNQSLLLKRIFLEDSNEEHMPPKGKPQLSNDQKELLEWWINAGADFNKKVKEISQTEKIKKTLVSLHKVGKTNETEEILPKITVSAPNQESVLFLKNSGVVVLPIEENSPFLSVTIFDKSLNMEQLDALNNIKQNIVSLNLRGNKDSQILGNLSEFQNLTQLDLSYSHVKDADIIKIKSLKFLKSLNLSGTAVTSNGIEPLKGLLSLKNLYLYSSKFDNQHFKKVKESFPNTNVDTGGYKINEMDSLKFVVNNN